MTEVERILSICPADGWLNVHDDGRGDLVVMPIAVWAVVEVETCDEYGRREVEHSVRGYDPEWEAASLDQCGSWRTNFLGYCHRDQLGEWRPDFIRAARERKQQRQEEAT